MPLLRIVVLRIRWVFFFKAANWVGRSPTQTTNSRKAQGFPFIIWQTVGALPTSPRHTTINFCTGEGETNSQANFNNQIWPKYFKRSEGWGCNDPAALISCVLILKWIPLKIGALICALRSSGHCNAIRTTSTKYFSESNQIWRICSLDEVT